MLFAIVYVLAYVPTIENYIYPDLAPVLVVYDNYYVTVPAGNTIVVGVNV